MPTDEQQIRELVATWMSATRAGDVDTVLSLMADDVVFLTPGGVEMTKADFSKAAKAMVGENAPQFDGSSDIQEVTVLGDWAYMRSKLKVVVTPPGGKPITRMGHTLSILRKENGRWVLARDANLLATTDDAS